MWIRTLCLPLLLGATPLAADPFWDQVNDDLFQILVEPRSMDEEGGETTAGPDLLWDRLDGAGATIIGTVDLPLAEAPETTEGMQIGSQQLTLRNLLQGDVRFQILSESEQGLPAGYLLHTGAGDHVIPGLRGYLSDCPGLEEVDGCKVVSMNRVTDLTLGLAACQCNGAAQDLGNGMVALNCYFGRPGTYIDYTLAYGPFGEPGLSFILDDPEGQNRRAICMASAAAHHAPGFLLNGDEVPGPAPEGIDPAAPLRMVSAMASLGAEWTRMASPLAIMQTLMSP